MTITPTTNAKCPHCGTYVSFVSCRASYSSRLVDMQPRSRCFVGSPVEGDNKGIIQIDFACYPSCGGIVINMFTKREQDESGECYSVWPLIAARGPVPEDVPDHIKQDFVEACRVLPFSAKASAALSRRCLQNVLIEAARVDPKQDLSQQIEEVLPKLPPYLAKQLDAIRNIGNFAAHPIKTQSTGQIVPVEPREAAWTLDVLEALFDHYYVQPRIAQERLQKLDQKLQDAGKPPVRQPPPE